MIKAYVNTVTTEGIQRWSVETIEDYKDYYKLLECNYFDVVYIEFQGHKLSVFCDDEGMLKSGNLGRLVADYPQPIFGNIVITGGVDDEGETLSVPDDLRMIDMLKINGEIKWQVNS